jgi:DNA-binding NarL/FixJ family response regulator
LKVLLVDDEPVMLKHILHMGGFDVDVAMNGYQALDLLEQEVTYNLMLLDIRMPVLGGMETLRMIRNNKKLQELHIIMLTANHMEDSVIAALDLGADEYLTKPISPSRLLAHLRALERRVSNKYATTPKISLNALTKRENEILRLVASGFSNKKIGETLLISELTVKNHLQNIFDKLGVQNRTQAAALIHTK